MCVRTLVSMVLSEVGASKLVTVQILSIVPATGTYVRPPEVPTHVLLPRFVWNNFEIVSSIFFIIYVQFDILSTDPCGYF